MNLFKRLDYWAFFLNEVNGVLWGTNSYWAVAVPDSTNDHPVTRMLAAFNLPLIPAVLAVGDTLTPAGGNDDPPDIAKLVAAVPDDVAPLEPYALNGVPLCVRNGNRWGALYQHPSGTFVALARRYVHDVEHMTPGAEWFGQADPHATTVRMKDGKVVGLLMPVRCTATGGQEA